MKKSFTSPTWQDIIDHSEEFAAKRGFDISVVSLSFKECARFVANNIKCVSLKELQVLKRYDNEISYGDHPCPWMEECDDGDWVKWEDIKSILKTK